MIYEEVCQLELNIRPFDLPCHPVLPWEALSLTCREVSQELRSHMASPSYLNNEKNRTFILEIAPCARIPVGTIGSRSWFPTWRSIPCRQTKARHLVLNFINTSKGILLLLELFRDTGVRLLDIRRIYPQLRLESLEIVIRVDDPLTFTYDGLCSADRKMAWIMEDVQRMARGYYEGERPGRYFRTGSVQCIPAVEERKSN